MTFAGAGETRGTGVVRSEAGKPEGAQEAAAAGSAGAHTAAAAAATTDAAKPAQPSAAAPADAKNAKPPSQPSSALPEHIATFADDLSSYVRYDRFEVMASLQQGDSRAASQQVSVFLVCVCVSECVRNDRLRLWLLCSRATRVQQPSRCVRVVGVCMCVRECVLWV